MRAENVEVPDPVDTAALNRWNAAVAAARAKILTHTASAARIEATLRLDDPTSPAGRAHARLDATVAGLTAAGTELADQQHTQVETDGAAKTAHATLMAAQNQEAVATKRVSDLLGTLMSSATTSTALTSTIDGMALRERYRAAAGSTPQTWDMATIPFRTTPQQQPADPQVRLPVIGDKDHAAVLGVLADLDDSVDAIADLVAAEAVHQLVAGNLVRSGAALEIAASGSVPDELAVITTPSTGYDVTHRLAILGEATPKPAWQGTASSLAAAVDPAFASWLSTLLPDPARVRLAVAALDPESGSVLASAEVDAGVLGVDAPDWLRVAGDPAELSARVAHAARPALAAALGTEVSGPVTFQSAPAPAAGGATLGQLIAAARTARRLVGSVRALQAGDLAPAGQDGAPPDDAAQEMAVRAVTTAQDALTTLDTDLGTADDDDLVAALLRATALGLAEATPPLAAGAPEPAALRQLAAAARTRLAGRLQVPRFTADPAGAQATVDAARALLPTLLGAPAPLLLPLTASTDTQVRKDLDESTAPLAAPSEVRQWLLDHGTVRPAVAALLDAYDTAEAFSPAAALRVRATQLPRVSGAAWAGTDPRPSAGLLDLVVVRMGAAKLPGRVSGLVVDSWVQTVAADGHAAAVSFHYDEPDADPPQALLVAVPPSLSPQRVPARWDLASLIGVVTSTMTQATRRAVAAELVDDASVTIGRRS
jgi:hypothetical protein